VRWRRVWVGLLIVGGGFVVAPTGGAHFSSSEYSYPSSSCSGAVDPVTLVLYGDNANDDRAQSLVQRETGWGGDQDNAGQYAGSHGLCTPMDGQSFDNCAVCNRKHVRYNQTHHRDGLGRLETVGTPHEERITTCGHVTFSYLSARNAILFAMDPPFTDNTVHYDGNTAALRQCDGSYASSDGYSQWINIG
jgi:hypothetical protein